MGLGFSRDRRYAPPCHGAVAEWLRSGLQSRLHRFDSGRRLSPNERTSRAPEPILDCAVAQGGRPDESSRRTRPDDGATGRSLMDQLVQILGSLLVLAAFVAAQRGRLATDSRRYLTLNLVG